MPSWNYRHHLLILATLLLITLIPYAQVHQHGFLALDDYDFISENTKVNQGFSFEGFVWAFGFMDKDGSYWRPLTWLTHMMDFELYGNNAGLHHLNNLLLHVCSTFLLYGFLYRSTRRPLRCAVVALIFAVHPINVESVAWLTERNNLLATCLGMGTLWLYAAYTDLPSRARYYMCLMAYMLCLLAKPILVTMPFLMLLLDYWPYHRIVDLPGAVKQAPRLLSNSASLPPDSSRSKPLVGLTQLLKEKLPFFIMAFAAMLPTFIRVGSLSSINDASIGLRLANAIVSYVKYMGNLIYPVDLAAFYPFPAAIPGWQVGTSLLLLLGITVYCIAKIQRAGYLLIGWLWFLGTLVPKIGLVQAGAWPELADRWAYFAAIGLYIAAVWWTGDRWEALSKMRRRVVGLTAVVVLCTFGYTTWRQVGYWADNRAVFERMLATTENNFFAHNLLGYVFVKERRLDEAIPHFKRAAELHPAFDIPLINLGSIAKQRKQYSDAISYFQGVLEISPHNGIAHFHLGDILYKEGQYDASARHFLKAIQLVPNSAVLYNGLGEALLEQGRIEEAHVCFQKSFEIDSGYVPAAENLATVLLKHNQ